MRYLVFGAIVAITTVILTLIGLMFWAVVIDKSDLDRHWK